MRTYKLKPDQYNSPFYLPSREEEIKVLVQKESQYFWSVNKDLTTKERAEYLTGLGASFMQSKIKKLW